MTSLPDFRPTRVVRYSMSPWFWPYISKARGCTSAMGEGRCSQIDACARIVMGGSVIVGTGSGMGGRGLAGPREAPMSSRSAMNFGVARPCSSMGAS